MQSTTTPAVLAMVLACTACAPDMVSDTGSDVPIDPCAALFGRPNENTGLDETACRPTCGCGATTFTPRAWDAASLAQLSAYEHANPSSVLTADPYLVAPPPDTAAVCAVVFEGSTRYRTATFPSEESARAAGAVMTHDGACGLCSSLADLRVYAERTDLTAPVRACGVSNFGDFVGLTACLEGLGFTPPCASIWAYDVEHTRTACGAICARLLTAPYHLPDGALNACLLCDETESGPVFKAVAGRTRRNSGLANAMCRPCSEVVPLDHAYPGL